MSKSLVFPLELMICSKIIAKSVDPYLGVDAYFISSGSNAESIDINIPSIVTHLSAIVGS